MHLQVPCPVTGNPFTIYVISRRVEILVRLVLYFPRKEGVFEEELDTFQWFLIVKHEGIFGDVSGH